MFEISLVKIIPYFELKPRMVRTVMDSEKEFLLNYYRKYTEFGPEEIETIVDNFNLIELERNEILLRADQPSRYSYLVKQGCLVNYSYDYNGEKVALNFIPENYWAGGGKHYNIEGVFIQSSMSTKVFQINSEKLEDLYRKNDKFAYTEISLLRGAFKALKQRMYDSLTKPTVYNYEQLIKKFPDIEQRVSQKDIASYLGVTRQFFSKMRSEYLKDKS